MFAYNIKLALKSMRRNSIMTALMITAIAVGIGVNAAQKQRLLERECLRNLFGIDRNAVAIVGQHGAVFHHGVMQPRAGGVNQVIVL